MDYLALDLETTGLSPNKERIIEIGAVKYRADMPEEEFTCLIRSCQPLPQLVAELTGITRELLNEQGEAEETAIRRFFEFAEDMPVLLGHNILFDYSFLKHAASRYGIEFERQGLDTLRFAKILLPELESRKLSDLCSYYGIQPIRSHRALEDAYSAARLFDHLRSEFPEYDGFRAEPLYCRVPKLRPVTAKQKKYLTDLMNYHGMGNASDLDELSQSEASRRIDQIILTHGRMIR